jgi:hypothetical protein
MIKALKNKYSAIKSLAIMVLIVLISVFFLKDPADALLLMYLELFAMMAMCGLGFWLARSFSEAMMKFFSFLIIAPIMLMIMYFGVTMSIMLDTMSDGALASNKFIQIMTLLAEKDTISDAITMTLDYFGSDLWLILVGFAVYNLTSLIIDQKKHKAEGKLPEDFDWWAGMLFQFSIYAIFIATIGSLVIVPIGLIYLATGNAELMLLIFLIVLRVSLVYLMGMVKFSQNVPKGKSSALNDVSSNEFNELFEDYERKKQTSDKVSKGHN